jgi:hypothetical protein
LSQSIAHDPAAAAQRSTRFSRLVFFIAGLYGIVLVAPEYFLEARYGIEHPPPIAHPEFYYGFVGLCLVFQLLFLLIASDPIRYRPIMLIGIAEKLCFVIPCVVLFMGYRIPMIVVGFTLLDLVWAAFFLAAYLKTTRTCFPPGKTG